MIQLVIAILLLSGFYFTFLLLVLSGIKREFASKTTAPATELPSVTIIVPFRNEISYIERSINSIKAQNYPPDKLQVIYVNDASTDGGEQLAKKIAPINFIIIENDEQNRAISPKKRAITVALRIATGEIIVCTDADCFHSEKWVTEMVSTFDANTGFVSGPATFISDGSLFQKLQQIEFAGLVLVGLGLIGLKKPLICNGANLAYRKETFFFVNGYEGNENLSSGDDEFLMQKIAHKSNYEVKFCTSLSSVVETEPNKSIGQFFRQRQRWASKGFHYDSVYTIIFLLALFAFYLMFFSLPLLGVVVNTNLFILFTFLLFLKAVIEYRIMRIGNNFLFKKIGLKYFLIGEIVQPIYIIFSSVIGTIGGLKWKEREVKR